MDAFREKSSSLISAPFHADFYIYGPEVGYILFKECLKKERFFKIYFPNDKTFAVVSKLKRNAKKN